MDHATLYRRWLLELWHGDLAVADEIVSPGFLVHQAGQPEEPRGPERARALVEQGRAPVTDVRLSLDVGPVVDGVPVAARWTFRGAYAGGIPGASAAPGTEIAFGGIDLMRVEDGRLAEYWVSSEGLDLMAQLGVG
jgi:hypothetical protein